MAKVSDVARYILDHLDRGLDKPSVPSWKLQKLVYYAQAWSLVWDNAPLLDSDIQTWANGPDCPDLYELHKGKYGLCPTDIEGDASRLAEDERDTVDAVLKYYGARSGHYSVS